MLQKPAVLLLALLFSVKAYALKDILNPCERLLKVADDVEVTLSPAQIAVNGPLWIYIEQGQLDATGYLVVDDFMRKNISPSGNDSARWVRLGDRMFILDSNGGLKVSGYFGMRQEVRQVKMDGMIFPVLSSVPYLFKDQTFSEPVTQPGELLEYFQKHARAVVIQNLEAAEIAKMQERLKPLFERYELNKTRTDRVVRIGRRRAYKLPHFQDGIEGKASVNSERQVAQRINWQTGEPEPGDPFWVLSYSMTSTEKAPPAAPGDYLMLLDENGNVTEEGIIASAKFPLWADTEEKAKAIEAKFKAAHSAFLAKNIVKKPAK